MENDFQYAQLKYFLLVQTLLTWIWCQAPHCLLFVYLSSLLGKGDCRGWEFIATQIENTEYRTQNIASMIYNAPNCLQMKTSKCLGKVQNDLYSYHE